MSSQNINEFGSFEDETEAKDRATQTDIPEQWLDPQVLELVLKYLVQLDEHLESIKGQKVFTAEQVAAKLTLASLDVE